MLLGMLSAHGGMHREGAFGCPHSEMACIPCKGAPQDNMECREAPQDNMECRGAPQDNKSKQGAASECEDHGDDAAMVPRKIERSE